MSAFLHSGICFGRVACSIVLEMCLEPKVTLKWHFSFANIYQYMLRNFEALSLKFENDSGLLSSGTRIHVIQKYCETNETKNNWQDGDCEEWNKWIEITSREEEESFSTSCNLSTIQPGTWRLIILCICYCLAHHICWHVRYLVCPAYKLSWAVNIISG